MKWKGETERQWLERMQEWHKYYCWLPRQIDDGTWVWLDYVWRKMTIHGFSYFFTWQFSDALTPPAEPVRPPPPTPTRPSKK